MSGSHGNKYASLSYSAFRRITISPTPKAFEPVKPSAQNPFSLSTAFLPSPRSTKSSRTKLGYVLSSLYDTHLSAAEPMLRANVS